MSTEWSMSLCGRDLTTARPRLRIRPISGDFLSFPGTGARRTGFMTPIPPPASSPKAPAQPCKHPRVQIVSRDEDSEYVECKECGEIFESSEFKDMLIEDTKFSKES